MKLTLFIIATFFFIYPLEQSQAKSPSLSKWKQRRSALDQVHIVDEFRIYYTLRGDDALPETHDSNHNSIPDRIENIALQLTTARDLYTNPFKLRHPLQSPRYKNKAKFIDVHVGSLPLSPPFNPDKIKGNGSAGDAIINYYRPGDPEGGIAALTMDISRKIPSENLTPAHELFHLFQNGYTMFKTSWFTEGTARWVESAFKKNKILPMALPQKQTSQDALFVMKYDASGFWKTLAQSCQPHDTLMPPNHLLKRRYIGDNIPIIQNTEFIGTSFIRPLLEALDAADDRVNTKLKLKIFDWTEAQQRSPDNNPYLWSALIEVISEQASNSPAIQSMIRNLPARKN